MAARSSPPSTRSAFLALACYRLLPSQSLHASSRVLSSPLKAHRPGAVTRWGDGGIHLERCALRALVEKPVSKICRPSPYHLAMPPQQVVGPRLIPHSWRECHPERAEKTLALQGGGRSSIAHEATKCLPESARRGTGRATVGSLPRSQRPSQHIMGGSSCHRTSHPGRFESCEANHAFTSS